MIRLLMLAFLSMLAFKGVVFAQSSPVFSDTGPEVEAYGASKDYPVPRLNTHRVSGRTSWLERTVTTTSCTRCAPFQNQLRHRS
jgi:hypothetical protein